MQPYCLVTVSDSVSKWTVSVRGLETDRGDVSVRHVCTVCVCVELSHMEEQVDRECLSTRQLYQVLGNSVNVRVVSVLIHLLVTVTPPSL